MFMRFLSLLFLCLLSSPALAQQAQPFPVYSGGCFEAKPDLEYHCPYLGVNREHDILFSQFKTLNTGKIDGSGEQSLVLNAPEGWGIIQSSISPDGMHMLLTMKKESCDQKWKSNKGRLCSWRRNVLWLAKYDPLSNIWKLENLAAHYGYNADIHGWTSWQSNRHALFNGIIRAEGVNVHGSDPSHNNAQPFQIMLLPTGIIDIRMWAPNKMQRPDCLYGRLFSSQAADLNECIDGAKVVYARRCYSEKTTPENYAWWNTENIDGSGRLCQTDKGALHVPVLRVYIVETDQNCQPKTFAASHEPVQLPRHDGVFRHMPEHVAEWGDMQPAISRDGKVVAFHTVKSLDTADPADNCSVFNYDKGIAPSRVYYCALDENDKCIMTRLLSKPDKSMTDQGMPMFIGDSILINEGNLDGVNIYKIQNGERTHLYQGIGGYPLK